MTLVRIGKVVRAIGLKGSLGVAGTDGALGALSTVTLGLPGVEPVKCKVLGSNPQGRLWALRIDGSDDRAAADRWVGAEVLAERSDLGEAGDGLHYWGDLDGLLVETVSGAKVGRVTGLLETGAVDVLVVTGEGGERLVPLAPYVRIDLAAGKVVVDPPDGLLELGVAGGEEG